MERKNNLKELGEKVFKKPVSGRWTYDNGWVHYEGFNLNEFLSIIFGEELIYFKQGKRTFEVWFGKKFKGETFLESRFCTTAPTLNNSFVIGKKGNIHGLNKGEKIEVEIEKEVNTIPSSQLDYFSKEELDKLFKKGELRLVRKGKHSERLKFFKWSGTK